MAMIMPGDIGRYDGPVLPLVGTAAYGNVIMPGDRVVVIGLVDVDAVLISKDGMEPYHAYVGDLLFPF